MAFPTIHAQREANKMGEDRWIGQRKGETINFYIYEYEMGNIIMDSLISNLVRPFRFTYSIFDLGCRKTSNYVRTDESILNERGYRIQYSYFENLNVKTDICFVYAHCNSGCRIQGLPFVSHAMQNDWNLCLFDFSGSGISQGQYISLGYYESLDLEAIVAELKGRKNRKFLLWGRSMGAATIIMYLSQTKQVDNIIACILDSPYNNLWATITEVGKSKTGLPEFIINRLISYLRTSVKAKYNFDIKVMQLKSKVQRIQIPTMYITSENDNFVKSSHVIELYKNTLTKKKVLEYIEQEHNSPREEGIIKTGMNFLSKYLKENERVKKREVKNGRNLAEKMIKPLGNGCSEIKRFNSFSFILNEKQRQLPQKQNKKQKYNQENQNPNLSSKMSASSLYHNISTVCYPKNKRSFTFKKSTHVKTEQKQQSLEFEEEGSSLKETKLTSVKNKLFNDLDMEQKEKEVLGQREIEKRKSLRQLFIKKKNRYIEEIETSKQLDMGGTNVVQLNIDEKMFKKRKPNNKNMIRRTSIKIDLNKVRR